jgi:hypothetical protein
MAPARSSGAILQAMALLAVSGPIVIAVVDVGALLLLAFLLRIES